MRSALLLALLPLVACAPTPSRPERCAPVCPDAGGADAGRVEDGGRVDGGNVDGGDLDGGDANSGAPRARYVILFVGDGMGAAQIEATRMFASGGQAPLLFEELEVRGAVRTANASGGVTDSAAAATAMATGRRVDNGVLSVALPGDGDPLPTALELHAACGRATGLVTTATPLTDATPAAFGAHEPSRHNQAEIAADYLTSSRPSVLLGPAGPGLTPDAALAGGYEVVTSEAELDALEPDGVGRVSGQFTTETVPRLAELVRFSLDVLEEDPDGFFLLVEHEGTDNGGHTGDLGLIIDSVLELEEAFEVARGWAEGRDDTLLVVTADHETGGLQITDESPTAGAIPAHAFSTGEHTGVDVPLYASGPGAGALAGEIDNTEIFGALTSGLCP